MYAYFQWKALMLCRDQKKEQLEFFYWLTKTILFPIKCKPNQKALFTIMQLQM
jgi:hypothetical protein